MDMNVVSFDSLSSCKCWRLLRWLQPSLFAKSRLQKMYRHNGNSDPNGTSLNDELR